MSFLMVDPRVADSQVSVAYEVPGGADFYDMCLFRVRRRSTVEVEELCTTSIEHFVVLRILARYDAIFATSGHFGL